MDTDVITLTKTVLLNSIDKARKFAEDAKGFSGTVDLHAGRYIVDGKSVMGIFSLNLNVPIEIILTGDREETFRCWQQTLSAYEADPAVYNVAG